MHLLRHIVVTTPPFYDAEKKTFSHVDCHFCLMNPSVYFRALLYSLMLSFVYAGVMASFFFKDP